MNKHRKHFFLKFGNITLILILLIFLISEIVYSENLIEKRSAQIASPQLGVPIETPQLPLDDGTYLKIIINPEKQTTFIGDDAEFTIVVLNTSSRVNLIDVVVESPLVPDCNRNIGNLAANSNFPPYQCTANNIQEAFANEITVTGKNATNKHSDVASAIGQVDLLGMEIQLDAQPNTMPEPGGDITFTLTVSNTGNLDISLKALESIQFGSITDPKNPNLKDNNCIPDPNLPILLAGIGTSSCTFTADFSSQPGSAQIDIKATAEDKEGTSLTENGRTLIEITNTPASISAELITDPNIAYAPKQTKTFIARVDNTSPVDKITLQKLSVSNIGNLNGIGNCSLPQTVDPGDFYTCSYDSEISGDVGEIQTINLQAVGEDDDIPPGQVETSHQLKIEFRTPPIYSIFFPVTSHLKDEPNNSCRNAYPIAIDKDYWFMAEDREDWYSFQLSEKTNLKLELTNYKPLSGQVIVYRGQCGSLNYVAHNGNFSETKTINLGIQDPGQYYVRVFTAEQFNDNIPYRLIINSN